MATPSEQIENAISMASEAMDEDPKLTGKEASRRFNAIYSRLMARRRGQTRSNKRGGHNKKLNIPQQQALLDYIDLMFTAGTPINMQEVTRCANHILYWNGCPEKVSKRWAKRWFTRNADIIKTLKSKTIASKRLESHIVDDIQYHFEEFRRCRNKWGICDADIYNFDETGFQIGVVDGEKVIVPKDCQAVYTADPDNRELVTAVCTLNPTGKRVPPVIIFKGAYHLRKHFDNDMDGDILFARSESGFANDRLGLKYLEHFNKFTEKNCKGAYRMLIFDGHSSHLTQEFVEYCWEHRIRPFQLPPHATHLLQPCDVGLFQALKHNFKKEMRREVHNGMRKVAKVDFFSRFGQFYERTIRKPRIYEGSYRKTGLIPFNPDIVLHKMKEFTGQQQTSAGDSSSESEGHTDTPHTPPPLDDWKEWPTPLTIRTLRRGQDYVTERVGLAIASDCPLTPSVSRVNHVINSATERSMVRGALSSQRIHDLNEAEKTRNERDQGSNRQVQRYGEIYGKQARRQIEEDKKEEERLVNVRNARMQKVWRKAYKQVVAEINTKVPIYMVYD